MPVPWLSNTYGIFIGVIGPIYVPFAVFSAKTNAMCIKIVASINVVCLGLAAYTLIGLTRLPITVQVINTTTKNIVFLLQLRYE